MTKHLRVIAPSSSLLSVNLEQRKKAEFFLASYGWSVSFAKGAQHTNDGTQTLIAEKAADLNQALYDSDVTHIMAAKGGWNAHEILPYVDWSLWRKYKKPLIGYSDTTTLLNAAHTQSEVNTLHSMHFSNFSDETSLVEKSYTNLVKCLSDDPYELSVNCQEFGLSESIRFGETSGLALGGNLTSLMLLAGTNYFPNLEESVVFIEDVPTINIGTFRRLLVQLCSQPGAENIKGFVFGRIFGEECDVNNQFRQVVEQVITADIPILGNVRFGHTRPINSFIIGRNVTLKVLSRQVAVCFNKKLR